MNLKTKITALLLSTIIILFIQSCGENSNEEIVPIIKAALTQAPNVPPPVRRNYKARVIVELEVRELVGQLNEGVEYTFWTFGGEVPGNFIRVREGDEIEFHLHNHQSSKLPHNIDLHAVTGPGGGAEASFTAPGHSSVFNFTALNPGLYVYHCATAPVGLHIANGMYGLILVEPEGGLTAVNREYYIMQSEFYTGGDYGEKGFQSFSMEKALDENPDYVVFNGSVGSMIGDKSLKANVGEKIRLFIGNGGPNLVSSFHVIGEIFDVVYQEGGTIPTQHNVQTTLIPAGGSAMVEFEVDVPGEFILVDHSIFRAFNKGALGKIAVAGNENEKIYSGKIEDNLYKGINESSGPNNLSSSNNSNSIERGSKISDSDLKMMGKSLYQKTCSACHGAEGKGLPNVFPPIQNSDWIDKHGKPGMISAISNGMSGLINVNGQQFNNVMPPQQLSDVEAAAVLTYVLKEINKKDESVTVEEVKKHKNYKVSSKK